MEDARSSTPASTPGPFTAASSPGMRQKLFSLQEPVVFETGLSHIRKSKAQEDPPEQQLRAQCAFEKTYTWTERLLSGGAAKLKSTITHWMTLMRKRSVMPYVLRAEAAKGYLVTEIHNNLLRHHSKDLEVSGGKAIDYDYVYNFCRPYKDKFATHRTGNRSEWDQQRYRAAEWLQTNGWYFQEIMAIWQSDKEVSFGLVFAHPERLEALVKYGYLTVMDSTHNTNKLRWHLFSLIVRAEYGNWIPAAHILTAKLDSDIVASALRQVRLWCEGHGGWALKYMLTDDSASEQAAVRKAF